METKTVTNLLELGTDGLREFVTGLGMPPYRAAQISRWVYAAGVSGFEEMTNLSRKDRAALARYAGIIPPALLDRQVSSDGTEKYLFGLADGETVESVMIPDEKRVTLCISSQVGCALGCKFCLTGAGGFKRDLLPHEITGQVLMAKRLAAPLELTNFVMMGMGEPLMNTKNVLEALRGLTSPDMFCISPRRITLSTAGVVPEIKALGESGIGVGLAVSLNATTDGVRDAVMPVNRKYPIKELMAALREFPLAPRRRITIEYVMLAGVNDTLADAKRLAGLLHGLKCKVNLIPYNPHPGSEYDKPAQATVLKFQEFMHSRGFTAFIRQSRGQDILAACGQLRARKA
ncbi:MAG TPA: 23S rRNA (adenine(2503)-C(2))-methyltransferase RlmN [Nitrospirota bacterium]